MYYLTSDETGFAEDPVAPRKFDLGQTIRDFPLGVLGYQSIPLRRRPITGRASPRNKLLVTTVTERSAATPSAEDVFDMNAFRLILSLR